MPDRAESAIEVRSGSLPGVVWDRVGLFPHASTIMVYKAHLVAKDYDLWCIQTSEHKASYQWDAQELSFLQPAELERARGFRFELHRRVFLAKRLLVRGVLSHYAAVAPQDWSFSKGPYGRPQTTCDREQIKHTFNLSSSGEIAVCVVTRAGLIGVDVEDSTGHDPTELSGSILSAAEEEALSHIHPANRRVTFLRYWTLKEAYVKARGIGLTIPVRQVGFDFSKAEKIAVSLGHELGDDSSLWEFSQHMIFDRYIVAVGKCR